VPACTSAAGPGHQQQPGKPAAAAACPANIAVSTLLAFCRPPGFQSTAPTASVCVIIPQ
jgi:hypothetical protein